MQQIWRNKGMSVASSFAITAMMLILGLFFVVTVNINMFTEVLRNNYNEVEVFLKDNVKESRAKEIMGIIEVSGGVKDLRYRSKDEAMDIMRKRWGENAYMLDTLGENYFPSSIVATVDSMESANDVIESLKDTEEVEDVKYYKEIVEKLSRITGALQIAALAIMIFLVIVSVVIVSNTIKLTVFARSKEIEIMKYIGATNWFIRGPFLTEGIILGIVSSGIASLITFFLYRQIIRTVGKSLMTILGTTLVPAGYLANNLIIIFLALGISIGACGSIISMRRFLDT